MPSVAYPFHRSRRLFVYSLISLHDFEYSKKNPIKMIVDTGYSGCVILPYKHLIENNFKNADLEEYNQYDQFTGTTQYPKISSKLGDKPIELHDSYSNISLRLLTNKGHVKRICG